MKYLICSDIHGSEYYLKKVLSFFDASFDKLIILGDILYHGPRNDLPKGYNPKKVISLLNPLKNKIIAIKGNCDAEVDQMVLEFEIMDEYRFSIDNRSYFLQHGHHIDFKAINKYEADVVMYGHFHIPLLERKGDVVLVNPGSISIPKSEEGNTFIIFENNRLLLKNLDFLTLKEFIL